MFAITTIITIAINFPGFENILTKFTSIFTIENSEECTDFKNSSSIKFSILNYAEIIIHSPC